MQSFRGSLVAVVTALALFACGKAKSPSTPTDNAQKLESKSEDYGVAPDLLKKTQEVQAGKFTDQCDLKFKATQLEISKELDSRFADIQKLLADPQHNKNYTFRHAGSILIKEYIKRPLPESNVWKESNDSWGAIQIEYERIKGISKTNDDWANLAIDVSSILTDDKKRTNGANVYLKRDSYPHIKALLSLVEECTIHTDCNQLTINDPALQEFTQSQPFYKDLPNMLLASQGNRKEYTALLFKWRELLVFDAEDSGFTKNKSVKRKSQSTFELTFDGAAFPGDALTLIQSYVESTWHSSAYQVKLIWNTVAPAPADLFKFILHQDGGSRSFVRYGKKEVHLYSTVKNTSIAHEFGHVLGLDDHYYTFWNPSECTYTTQSLATDIMSMSRTGSVTEDDWKELDSAYPL